MAAYDIALWRTAPSFAVGMATSARRWFLLSLMWALVVGALVLLRRKVTNCLCVIIKWHDVDYLAVLHFPNCRDRE